MEGLKLKLKKGKGEDQWLISVYTDEGVKKHRVQGTLTEVMDTIKEEFGKDLKCIVNKRTNEFAFIDNNESSCSPR